MSDRRVSIVTGASQGIGRVIATELASRGDIVVLAARNTAGLEETAGHIDQAGGKHLVIETDVTSDASVGSMVAAVTGQLGRIDNLVNNSGVGGPSGRLWEVDSDEWRSTYEVNVFGVFSVTRAVLPVMIQQGSGSVVIVGSISGKRPLFGRSAYTSTKTALTTGVRISSLNSVCHRTRSSR